MTSYEDLQEAAQISDYDESIRRIKQLAAQAISGADRGAQLLFTDNFNHSYLPDFVLRWNDRPDRLVFLRASSYAQEIEEDVVNLADKQPIFVQLSEFRPYGDRVTPRDALDSLGRSASATKSLVTSVPAIGLLDGPRSQRTGRIFSSYVMRGGRGLVEDSVAPAIAERVETGFTGALEADRARTADALQVVEDLLDPRSSAEFSHLLEAAWISGGAAVMDFPGAVSSIGESLSSSLLRQLLDIVPEDADDAEEFWTQVGNAISLESFQGLNLVGTQSRLQLMMGVATEKLMASRCSIRKTVRSDLHVDPLIWQVENGILSLRGGGYQGWVGKAPSSSEEERWLDEPPTLAKVYTRAENAKLTLTEIGVRDDQGMAVRFSSSDGTDIATSDLVHRVSETLGTSVRVDSAFARVSGKSVKIDLIDGIASGRTNARIGLSELMWNAWNIIAGIESEDFREELKRTLSIDELDEGSADTPELRPPFPILKAELPPNWVFPELESGRAGDDDDGPGYN
ncbi:hypothetical protein [Nocardia huaxiensis]|uniref:Uncharacterized protein n=1 Tax=Nocardia huaxiensis TaxID=2755382 RepID=A0A7D6ZHV2_9NOCA|nr:hypothetical protein [Nocardia huaxiensis]QLY33978.1 hypothetical protein H0264_18635 [Nocardia huaxiensis]UFS99120.1 hypothetical protein LPY97_15075 [Nocardia huaxiensis]